MSSVQERDILKSLVQQVTRAFYEAKYTIIMDQLARHPVLKDDDLASRMGLQPKELNKIIAVLSNDSLVKVYRQNELKEGAMRAVGKQYYYIDYAGFCNVVKWRIARMHKKIDNVTRNELDQKGYLCLQCKASYTPLDVDKLMDMARGIFVCEVCHAEVVDNEVGGEDGGKEDRMSRFNHEIRFILAGLKQTEGMVLPPFDAAAWIKTNLSSHAHSASASASNSSGLKIAGANGTTQEDSVKIVISDDMDEATRRMERDAQAEVKRQQNALPAWHLKSTISGDLTALGVKENEREGASRLRAEAAAALSSNDEILRGLGVVGARPTHVTATMESFGEGMEDVKPVVNHEADYYDAYYASLASASTSATPSFSSSYPSSAPPEDEEDEKPSVEYLTSLNDYRKRSRSDEDVGRGSRGSGKVVKTETTLPVEFMMSTTTTESASAATDDPVVYVNGVGKRFSEVTEEDHENMTPDEYTVYFEVLQGREGF